MSQFLFEYGLFFAKAVTVVLALLFVLGSLFSALAEVKKAAREEQERSQIQMSHLNGHYEEALHLFQSHVLDEKSFKKWKKQHDKAQNEGEKPILFVIDFEGDVEASATEDLRECITFIIQVARPEQDRVLLRLESAGGLVHAYGLAASQLHRLRARNIHLSICVDKVAASGGYMMACLANELVAAPFAIIGSIGVIGALPNVHRLLKKNDIDYEEHTAGEFKRTLTVFGENSNADRRQFQHELNLTHDLFKQHIQYYRPQLQIEAVATGETWYGSQALERQLIDALGTSDDYLLRRAEQFEIYLLSREKKESGLALWKARFLRLWQQGKRFLSQHQPFKARIR